MIIVLYIILTIYSIHICVVQNWGRVWVERPNAILFGSNDLMLYCLGRTAHCYIVWVERPIAILFEEICIYYMHFVCCNAYILWIMLIIESMLYVYWVNFVWSALPNVFAGEVRVKYYTICAHVRTL
jgi:hypothetical protein